MSPTAQGSVVLVVTVLALLTGIPVAFGLGAIAVIFLVLFQGFDSMQVVAETFYSSLDEFTLVAIPMFIMMGAAIGSSPAGKDLYEALDRWLYRVPGGLVISNLGACAIFAALDRLLARHLRRHRQDGHPGDAPARLSGRGRHRLDLRRRHARHSDSAVDHLHPLRHRHRNLDRPPVPRRRVARPAADRAVHAWTLFYIWFKGFRAYAPEFRFTWKQKFESIPKVAPFLAVVIGVMYVLYGGVATPSEAAGVGAAFCVLLAIVIYRMWSPTPWWEILRSTTRESVMILMIIATAALFGYMLTSLYITQTLAQAIADAHFNRWVLMGMINLFLLVCGCFIPPAGIILMTAPILLPIITAAGFDPVWFGVIVTINMEIGLITPPVGLNLFVVNAIAPGCADQNGAVGLGALCHDDDCRHRHLVYLPGNRHMVAEPSDGRGNDDGCRTV